MVVVLTAEQIELILKSLPKKRKSKACEYLATYLEYVKNNQPEQPSIDLDEIPF